MNPLDAGRFFFPAEWHPHVATILGFPSRASSVEALYEPLCNEIVDLAAAIADFEPVRLHARPEDIPAAQALVKRKVRNPTQVSIVPVAINHCWVRDTGPVYVHDASGKLDPKQRLAINFKFNEWGNKNGWVGAVDEYRFGTPAMTAEILRENTDFARNVIAADDSPSPVQAVVSRIRAEGGALVVDGEGTLIVAESCMVCEQRNPGLSRDEIEAELRRVLGVEKVIWVPGRKNLDITDSHLDAEVRFVRPGVVVWSRHHPDSDQDWLDLSHEVLEALQSQTDAKGRKLEIHAVDEPPVSALPCAEYDEFVSGYVNFYFCNGGLIMPAFGAEGWDQRAKETLQALMPEREVRQVHLNAIPLSGGVIHCVTQQVPAPLG
ncbi:peptidyl-arginine deiminase domain protein [Aspergillus taichungensis]|uniref:Peptidyl-arginine deiminase domain protein n=1 Tax=Aspergillus taichungensis TaxID=482145 RepID=A0A2J5HX91_9EURO|nr:peptidyl-arginine deiminase domain protein [Aspergillus taichungensis]